tara:strand:+ start:445 stop:1446 length:1002 start_codon:yes stop_codon:yes gene_type:complete
MRVLTLSLAALALTSSAAFAASIIDNGVIQLGVDDFGQLNIDGGVPSPVDGTTEVGLRFLPSGNEATSHGCLCEGWGVGIADTMEFGFANNDDGVSGLSLVSFGSTASTATSVVEMGTSLRVTHSFGPAAETPNLYRVNVSIENISGVDINDLRYTRTFDWDIEPETFSELVTHAGVETTTALLYSNDNGFNNSNPFAVRNALLAPANSSFEDSGPRDHGSNFDFGFGGLMADDTYEFDIFYGAAGTEAGALAALGEVGAELYSLGQCGSDPEGLGLNGCNTFIFGFSGVGGAIVIPDPTPTPGEVPIPAAGWLFLSAIGGLGALRFRKSKAA